MEIIIAAVLSPILGAVAGGVAGRIGSNAALEECERAREACNHKVEDLENVVLVTQARVAALEGELRERDARQNL